MGDHHGLPGAVTIPAHDDSRGPEPAWASPSHGTIHRAHPTDPRRRASTSDYRPTLACIIPPSTTNVVAVA